MLPGLADAVQEDGSLEPEPVDLTKVDPEEYMGAGKYARWKDDMEERMSKQTAEYADGRKFMQEEQRACVQEIKNDGNAAFKKGNIAEAIKHYSEAIDMDRLIGIDEQVTATLYCNRAAAYLKQAEVGHEEAWSDAERDCQRSLERQPTAKAYLRRARALSEGLAKPADAFECLAAALALEPTNGVVRQAIAALREAHTSSEFAAPAAVVNRLRRRHAQRKDKGHEQEAQHYADALAILGETLVPLDEAIRRAIAPAAEGGADADAAGEGRDDDEEEGAFKWF